MEHTADEWDGSMALRLDAAGRRALDAAPGADSMSVPTFDTTSEGPIVGVL